MATVMPHDDEEQSDSSSHSSASSSKKRKMDFNVTKHPAPSISFIGKPEEGCEKLVHEYIAYQTGHTLQQACDTFSDIDQNNIELKITLGRVTMSIPKEEFIKFQPFSDENKAGLKLLASRHKGGGLMPVVAVKDDKLFLNYKKLNCEYDYPVNVKALLNERDPLKTMSMDHMRWKGQNRQVQHVIHDKDKTMAWYSGVKYSKSPKEVPSDDEPLAKFDMLSKDLHLNSGKMYLPQMLDMMKKECLGLPLNPSYIAKPQSSVNRKYQPCDPAVLRRNGFHLLSELALKQLHDKVPEKERCAFFKALRYLGFLKASFGGDGDLQIYYLPLEEHPTSPSAKSFLSKLGDDQYLPCDSDKLFLKRIRNEGIVPHEELLRGHCICPVCHRMILSYSLYLHLQKACYTSTKCNIDLHTALSWCYLNKLMGRPVIGAPLLDFIFSSLSQPVSFFLISLLVDFGFLVACDTINEPVPISYYALGYQIPKKIRFIKFEE